MYSDFTKFMDLQRMNASWGHNEWIAENVTRVYEILKS